MKKVEGREEGKAEGLKEGADQKAIQIAKRLLLAKMPAEDVAKHIQLPLDVILSL